MNRRTFFRRATAVFLGFVAGASRLAGSTVPDLVREGIGSRRSLRFTYAGHVRLVEPHALGRTPGGHRALIAWQFGGTSRQTPPTGWRTFLLSEMHGVQITVRTFKVRADYHRDRLPLRDIEADVVTESTRG